MDHPLAKSGWAMVRSANDFVILCRRAAEAHHALAAVRQWVTKAGLTLHPEKTRVRPEALTSSGLTASGA